MRDAAGNIVATKAILANTGMDKGALWVTKNDGRDWVERSLAAPGIAFQPVDAAVAAESMLLPGDPQGDPADRFLIATARVLGLPLATRDEQIVKYAKSGFLRVMKI